MLQKHRARDDIVAGESQQLQHAIFHLGDADRMAVDADQALDLVDRKAAAAEAFRHIAARRLERLEQARGRFLAVFGRNALRAADQRLLDLAHQVLGFLDQASAFLEAASRPLEHGLDLHEACGKCLFSHVLPRSPGVQFRPPYCGT